MGRPMLSVVLHIHLYSAETRITKTERQEQNNKRPDSYYLDKGFILPLGLERIRLRDLGALFGDGGQSVLREQRE